jgi:DNA polymerase-4
MGERDILHIDMDAFYAAVEQRDNPALRGKPVLVGGPSGRGVVSTASYEARPFGCRSAMPMRQAMKLCPQATVVMPRMERYVEVSRQVFGILEEFTPLVEPLSIDEAFLDVTGSTRLFGSAETIAAEIKRRVRETTELTASVGVAPSKFVAKLASDFKKPDGLVVVAQDEVASFLAPLPIGRMWGIGAKTLPKIEQLGVHTFGDLLRLSQEELTRRFGDFGERFYRLSRGLDERDVIPDRDARSISHECTFEHDVDDPELLRATLLDQVEHVASRLRRHDRLARCVVMKLRTPDFETITRRSTLEAASDTTEGLWAALRDLFEEWLRSVGRAGLRRGETCLPVRLIGAGVTQIVGRDGRQLSLFGAQREERLQRLDRTVDAIRDRFGDGSIRRGPVGYDPRHEV